jgi:hypothetical protein
MTKEDAMNMDEAWRLQREWKAKGNTPCDHSGYEMERFQPVGDAHRRLRVYAVRRLRRSSRFQRQTPTAIPGLD